MLRQLRHILKKTASTRSSTTPINYFAFFLQVLNGFLFISNIFSPKSRQQVVLALLRAWYFIIWPNRVELKELSGIISISFISSELVSVTSELLTDDVAPEKKLEFVYEIWQILKRFSGALSWAQTLKLGGVYYDNYIIIDFTKNGLFAICTILLLV